MWFGVLGPVRVEQAGAPIAIPSKQLRRLLVALLARPNATVSAAVLEDVLWGDTPPASARASLHNQIMRLRRLLQPGGDERIVAAVPGYRIRVEDDECDVTEFLRLHREADRARDGHDWDACSRQLSAALAYWRGEPYHDLGPTADLPAGAAHLGELRRQALEWRIDADLRRGAHERLVAELSGVVAEFPFAEAFRAQQMQALYLAGRQAEALDAYRQARQALVDELGVEPGPMLRRLHRQILRGEPLVIDGARSGGPARSSPAQLPADLVDFTGRDAPIASLSGLLRGDAAPGVAVVATIAGMGGIGKSALAVHVAHRVRDGFPDGQIYVALQGTTAPRDPAAVIQDILEALGVQPAMIPTHPETLAAFYRSTLAQRRVLLLLEDAADPAQVRPLLPGTSSCRVIVTSRARLAALTSAVRVDLDLFSVQESRALLAGVLGAARVDGEPDAVDAIVEICAGLPLAIRIAAARLSAHPEWTLRGFADRLVEAHPLDELAVDDLALRTTFHVSYDALVTSADERDREAAYAFRMLGLWTGPDISAAAAGELLDRDPAITRAALDLLADAHLIDGDGTGRYRLHDLLRVYGRDRAIAEVAPAERAAAIERIITWYAHSAIAAVDQFHPSRSRHGIDRLPPSPRSLGFADRALALAWGRAERFNLAAAIALASERGLTLAAWMLPATLLNFYNQCGYFADVESTHRLGLAAARVDGDPVAQARILVGLSLAARRGGRPDEALAHSAEVLRLLKSTDAPELMSASISLYADALQFAGRHEEALEWYRMSLSDQSAPPVPGVVAATLNNIGVAEHGLGRFDEAIATYEKASAMAHEAGAPYVQAAICDGMGQSYHRLGDLDQAIAAFDEAIRLRTEIGDDGGLAASLDRLGDAWHARGQDRRAVTAWRDALSLLQELGHPGEAALRAKLDEVERSS